MFLFLAKKPPRHIHLLRSAIFGFEDSLVSSVGFLSGLVASGADSASIIRSGVILIIVEAFSMGVGTFLSENNSSEIEHKKKVSPVPAASASFVMMLSYLSGGFFVLAPYFALTVKLGSIISISFSLLGLAITGLLTARFARTNYIHELLKTVLVGGLAVIIGVVVGRL